MSRSLLHSMSLKNSLNITPKLNKYSSVNFEKPQSPFKTSRNSDQDLSPQLKAKKKSQLQKIELFVEEVAADPTLLMRLVDYKQLIENLKEEHQKLKLSILQSKQQLDCYRKKIQSISGVREDSAINLIKKQESKISFQIIQLLNSQKELQKQIKKKLEQRSAEQKKAKQKILNYEENIKIKTKEIQQIIKEQIQKKKISQSKIKQLQNQTEQLRKKFTLNGVKKQKLKQIANIVRDKKIEMSDLKRKQTQELKKYRQQMMKKKSIQIELKKTSEKKLNKFIIELSKIIDNADRQSFNILTENYDNRKPLVRQKNPTSDTKPDESSQNNEDEQANQHELEDMETKNPILRQNKSMNIKSFTDVMKPIKSISQNCQEQKNNNIQYQTKQKELLSKIQSLGDQQQDLDGFVETLREKLKKLHAQLSPSQNNNITR